jgi:hypothetical protein
LPDAAVVESVAQMAVDAVSQSRLSDLAEAADRARDEFWRANTAEFASRGDSVNGSGVRFDRDAQMRRDAAKEKWDRAIAARDEADSLGDSRSAVVGSATSVDVPRWPFTDFDKAPDDPRSIAAFQAYQQACEVYESASSRHSDLMAATDGLSVQSDLFRSLQEQYMAAGRDMSAKRLS